MTVLPYSSVKLKSGAFVPTPGAPFDAGNSLVAKPVTQTFRAWKGRKLTRVGRNGSQETVSSASNLERTGAGP